MKVKSSVMNLCRKMLYESLTAEMMVRFVKIASPDYDINVRSGIPENIPITNQMAAEQIVADVVEDGLFLPFIETLVTIDASGFMGREYPLKGLREIVKGLAAEGYLYDRTTGLFLENSQERQSPNWGRLMDGDEKQMAVLRLDIVGNSLLVKKNPEAAVKAAYGEMRSIVNRVVVGRLGRVWSWEGDGVVAAFLFGQKERSAILAGMEILSEMFWFNRLSNPLKEPIQVRLAAHTGHIKFFADPLELFKNETLKEVVQLEAHHTPSDTLCVSQNLFMPIDHVIQARFRAGDSSRGAKVMLYSIQLERP